MKYRSTTQVSDNLHIFGYGEQGAGKTKMALDFHLAGQHVVIVTTEAQGDMCFHTRNLNVPVLFPEDADELVAIITVPEKVIAEVVHKGMSMPDYHPKTFVFDGIRGLQRMVFGELKKPERTVFNGTVQLPETGRGLLALPGKRGPGVPSNQDYRKLDLDMRNYLGGVEHMPYHTIVTAHAERDYSMETRLSLTGDMEHDKMVTRNFYEYPSLEGFSLKHDLPGVCSSFYLRMRVMANRYTFLAHGGPEFHARTRIAEVMPITPIDWTNTNMYEFLQRKIAEAKTKLSKQP